jgi:hypothetical protein
VCRSRLLFTVIVACADARSPHRVVTAKASAKVTPHVANLAAASCGFVFVVISAPPLCPGRTAGYERSLMSPSMPVPLKFMITGE